MTSGALSTFLKSINVESLNTNRYSPSTLAEHDVCRTRYYRRNRREFESLAARYGHALNSSGTVEAVGDKPYSGNLSPGHSAADHPIPQEQSSLFPLLEIRHLGGILGYGLFTLSPLKPGDLIGEYTGIVRAARPGQALPGGGFSSDYAWGFPKVRNLGPELEIDAREAGGILRFANHAEDPAAEPEHFAIAGCWRIIFIARRNLAPGEEITVDYGDAYWSGGERELVEQV